MNEIDGEQFEVCPLCGCLESIFFFEDKFRRYRRCPVCRLIFVPAGFHVDRSSEKARYEEHNNDADDAGYRQFLSRIIPPIQLRFTNGACGLDFGCGPTPLLARLLADRGFEMAVYDPFYAKDEGVFEGDFDFVVTTEVVEHLSRPLEEFEKLFSMVRYGGVLAVMTRLFDDSIDFSTWHYKNDRTHICFYAIETIDWIASRFRKRYTRPEDDICIFEEFKT